MRQIFDADVAVGNRRPQKQFPWRTPEDGILFQAGKCCSIGRVDVDRGRRCTSCDLLQSIDDIHDAGDFEDAKYKREKKEGNYRELDRSRAGLGIEWTCHLALQ